MSLTEIKKIINFRNPFVQKILMSFGIVIISYFLAFWIVRLINSRIENFKRRHQARRYTYYLTTLIAAVSMGFIWAKKPEALTTYFGFLSAGLALALHQVLLNIAGWVLILVRRPFDLGDRIEWGEVQGDVIDIQVFYTTLLEVGNWVEGDQSTGRVVNVPNSTIFKEALFNFTHGFEYIWNEIKISITFESNWEKAQDIMLEIANKKREKVEEEVKSQVKKMGKRYMIMYTKLSPIVYTDIGDNGVQLTLRYLTSVRKKRVIQARIHESILKRFDKIEDVEFAYSTWRVYNRNENGRDETERDKTEAEI